ncbi:sulfotransferase [Arthrobacter castelli]|uniref:sulfotransferase n=1 Tax=Arthrobacter castelli TaxID=271431 RepID=UPI0004795E8A|nr:sulfotransferase [Arthrobacter castelli]
MPAIVYIAGAARSGSTLLGEILGAQPRVLDGGEMALFWRDAARGNRCACGQRLIDCEVWGAALGQIQAEHGITRDEYSTLATTRARLSRTTRPRRLAQMRRDPASWTADEQRLVSATSALVNSALSITDSEVLIDTSKTLPALLFHDLDDSNNVTTVQLIRDPRAVAASTLRSRNVQRGNEESLPPGGSLSAAILRWLSANSTAALGRWRAQHGLKIRYEELMQRPATVTQALCSVSGIAFDPSTFVGNELRPRETSHAAVGNPRRGGSGPTKLIADERWRDELTTTQQRLVAAPTWLMNRLLSG